ncbi:MAG: TolC family protein [Deltaproteobacteria bacterium]|nr:TolC family protein [Deltaproteobacteria bacterium]
MKRALFLLFLIGLVVAPRISRADDKKMTLGECYQYALQRSETVAISEQEIARAQAIYTQALGSVLPRLSLNVIEVLQDSSANTDGAGSVGSTFTQFSRPSVALTMNQAIFRGFKEFRALKLAKINESQKRSLQRNAERLLFQDVAIVFLTIFKIERDIEITQQIIQVERSSIGELARRVRLGKSRDSEAALLEADIALLEAQLEQKRGQRRTAYDNLAFLTGLQPQPAISYDNPPVRDLKAIDFYTEKLDARPDVQAARDDVQLAKGEVKIRQGDLLPQADLTANYYPYRTGFQKDIKWDATFNVGIPVFNWETVGKIREAKTLAKQSQLKEELTRRGAVTEVQKSYDGFVSSRNEYQKFQNATAKARQSYNLQSKDFTDTLITTLDLLQSQQTWLDALRQRNTAEVQTWLDWLNLQVTSGIMP